MIYNFRKSNKRERFEVFDYFKIAGLRNFYFYDVEFFNKKINFLYNFEHLNHDELENKIIDILENTILEFDNYFINKYKLYFYEFLNFAVDDLEYILYYDLDDLPEDNFIYKDYSDLLSFYRGYRDLLFKYKLYIENRG